MKKSLLSIGAASLAIAFYATGCASTPATISLAEEVKKAEAVVSKARGLENHEKLDERHLIPNLLLEQSKVLYISWAAVATDSIGLRFGEADVISVSRDATDSNYLKLWDALRNADANKENAVKAAAELEKVLAESYKKNKTTSKLSDKAMFDTVVGKIAQEDYIAYKKALKEGASESDYKNQKTWLAAGKANALKVAAEQKKLMEAAEKRLAAAEKDAAAAKRKVELVLKYNVSKLAIPGIKIGIVELNKVLINQCKLPAPVAVTCCAILQKGLVDVMVNNMEEAKKEWPGVETALKDSIEPYKMPKFNAVGVNPFNASSKVQAYCKEVTNSVDEWSDKAFKPWKYATEIGGKRWDSFWEVKKWAKEAQKTLDEVSGN